MQLPNEHLDQHGVPWCVWEKAYWKNFFYVVTGLCWFILGISLGMLIGAT
jgi:hypothetical protein